MSIEPETRFGKLVVLEDQSYKRIICKCDCGKQIITIRCRLVSGDTKSCGCFRSEKLKEKWATFVSTLDPTIGAVFGRLTVVSCNRQMLECLCECGNTVIVLKYDVLNGKTQSCGCFSREVSAENMRKSSTVHGSFGSKEWNSWHSMMERCFKPEAMGYENYGGRGITVCDRWLNTAGRGSGGFVNFFADVGKAPSLEHTLDRIDPNGNYAPENVRWATKKEQARNRRTNRLVAAFGKTQCLAAWAEETGSSDTTISLRILKGWSPERALTNRKREYNMMEAAAVFDFEGKVIFWHLPPGRTIGWLPDSRDLWTFLWESRGNLGGIAHTHPWHGEPVPSGTDVTTFSALELALGMRLIWPIVTLDKVTTFRWVGPGKYDYKPVPFLKSDDVFNLRKFSD